MRKVTVGKTVLLASCKSSLQKSRLPDGVENSIYTVYMHTFRTKIFNNHTEKEKLTCFYLVLFYLNPKGKNPETTAV